MIIFSIIFGLFMGISTFSIMIFLKEYDMSFPMSVISFGLCTATLMTVFLITNKGIKLKRDKLTNKLKNNAYFSALGVYKENGQSHAITFFWCDNYLFISFLDKKNDIEIPYDDILKVHVFVEQNSLIIETTDLNSYALDLYDIVEFSEVIEQNKIEYR